MERTPRRTIKDSVFVKLFNRMPYVLEAYRSIHPEDDGVTEKDLEILTLQAELMNTIYNDLAMLVRGRIIILVEAQSTFTKNLAVRFLLYYAETIKRYLENHNMSFYTAREVSFPLPEFYVVYVGARKDIPDVIRFSDLYLDRELYRDDIAEQGILDFKIHVIRKTDRGSILDQYIRFCEITDESRRQYGSTPEAVTAAIDRCMEEGILTAFLSARREEVQSIMMNLFHEEAINQSYERAIRHESEQAGIQKGIQKGRQEGILKGRQEGLEDGIRAMIEVLKSISYSRDSIVNTIAGKFNLPLQTAAEKVASYW